MSPLVDVPDGHATQSPVIAVPVTVKPLYVLTGHGMQYDEEIAPVLEVVRVVPQSVHLLKPPGE